LCPIADLYVSGKDKISILPRRQTRNLVTVVTELSRLIVFLLYLNTDMRTRAEVEDM